MSCFGNVHELGTPCRACPGMLQALVGHALLGALLLGHVAQTVVWHDSLDGVVIVIAVRWRRAGVGVDARAAHLLIPCELVDGKANVGGRVLAGRGGQRVGVHVARVLGTRPLLGNGRDGGRLGAAVGVRELLAGEAHAAERGYRSSGGGGWQQLLMAMSGRAVLRRRGVEERAPVVAGAGGVVGGTVVALGSSDALQRVLVRELRLGNCVAGQQERWQARDRDPLTYRWFA